MDMTHRQLAELDRWIEREPPVNECEWHEGQPADECPDCELTYEIHIDHLIDMAKEER